MLARNGVLSEVGDPAIATLFILIQTSSIIVTRRYHPHRHHPNIKILFSSSVIHVCMNFFDDTLVSKICGSSADHWTMSITGNHATREDFRLNVTAFWLLPGRKITNYLEIISTSDWADPAPVARTKHWQVQSLPMHTAHTYTLHTA